MTTHTRAQAELLGLAVHEFRTPVTVLSGYLRMLSRQQVGPLSERQQKLVEEAERSCARLTALVGEMSELANLDGGSARLAAQDVPLKEVLEQAVAGIDEGRERGVTAALTGSDAAVVTGDRTRLSAALAALVRAVLREQTAAVEVPVSLQIREAEGRRMAAIAIGHEPDGRSLFDAPDGALNEFRGGLGLAVPIARRVIAHHGGRVWSSSNGRLMGSVAVLLPLRENRS